MYICVHVRVYVCPCVLVHTCMWTSACVHFFANPVELCFWHSSWPSTKVPAVGCAQVGGTFEEAKMSTQKGVRLQKMAMVPKLPRWAPEAPLHSHICPLA